MRQKARHKASEISSEINFNAKQNMLSFILELLPSLILIYLIFLLFCYTYIMTQCTEINMHESMT